MTYINAFEKIVQEQLARAERMAGEEAFIDYAALPSITIGLIDGDGIGPVILREARRVLAFLLKEELSSARIRFRDISGLTLENRLKSMEPVPGPVLEEIKACHVLLKGPTTTPSRSDNLPDLESANVTLRRELDLFANVRPVRIPEKNIDWTFFRENTEGEYVLGSRGVDISPELAVDFKVTTNAGTRRIARAAFEYARSNGGLRVSIVTKANIMKKTDGKFLELCRAMAKEYPDIQTDDWYVDIMAANLINEELQSRFNVFILPNLYGDIITDEAAQLQGGVGTAGSANTGSRYAMFEAIHGSAPRMVSDGIAEYANPASILRAAEMMLRHIGMSAKADLLSAAIDGADSRCAMPGNGTGHTAAQYADAVLAQLREAR